MTKIIDKTIFLCYYNYKQIMEENNDQRTQKEKKQ